MNRRAHVASTEALRQFHDALREYNEIVAQVLTTLQTEVQRGRDWVEQDRLPHWQAEVRQAQETLVEDLNRLERKQISFDPSDSPSCHEEQQAVRRTRQRLREAEQKTAVTQRWLHRIRTETDEFRNLLAKLQHLSDSELPRAVASLAGRIQALNKYTDRSPPPTATPRINSTDTDSNGAAR